MTEVGRSMVEMLGVLAIMGIVGLVGVRMYNAAMNKHHANTLIEQAQRRAVSAASQINLMGHAPSLADFTENTFGGGTFGGVTQEGLYQQFGIQVSNVPKPVCENILNAIGENTSLRRLSFTNQPKTALTNCIDNNNFLMIYNNDMSAQGADTKYVIEACTCQTVCGQCIMDEDEVRCVGECPINSQQCTTNADCSGECVGCVIPDGQSSGTCQACQRVGYLESKGNQFINTGTTLQMDSVIEAVFKVSSQKGDELVIGVLTPNAAIGLYGRGTSASFKNGIGTQVYYGKTTVEEFLNTLFTASLRNGVFTVNGKSLTFNKTTIFNNNKTAYLFAGNNSGPYGKSKIKAYSFKIYHNTSLVRDFVPVLDPTGVPALYDKVSKTLFYNAGTGQFGYGS